MIIAPVFITLLIVLLIWYFGREQVPWASDLKRIHAGIPKQAEWMASHEIIAQVEADYMASMAWLSDSALDKPDGKAAAMYLCEAELERYEAIAAMRDNSATLCEVLRATHDVQVRRFGEYGERCLVVDIQQERRMATYQAVSGRRVGTQALGTAVMVYEMAYDLGFGRWRVARCVQQLPVGWIGHERRDWFHMQVEPLERVGRDG